MPAASLYKKGSSYIQKDSLFTFQKFAHKSLKEGAFLCLQYNLYLEGHGNILFLRSILMDTPVRFWAVLPNKTEIFLAYAQQKPVASVIILPNKNGRRFLVSVFVLKKYRRKGLGTQLFEYAKFHTRRRNFYAQTSSSSSKDFYASLGIKTLS